MLKKARITKEKRSTRSDFTHRTFAEKGGGVAGNTHVRTLNNTDLGRGLG